MKLDKVSILIMMESKQKNSMTISAINCSIINISTIGSRNANQFLNIEGITERKAVVIWISDVRAKNKREELKKMFRFNQEWVL